MGRETSGRNVAAEDRDTYANGAAFVDGQFVPIAEARVPILDWGFLRSDATYDVAHVWRGNFFRLEDHLDRFERSMEHLRLSLPYGRDEIRDILVECVRLSGLRDAYTEIICTRGIPRPGSRDPRECENRFYAFVVPFIWIADPEKQKRGLHAVIADRQRIAPSSVDRQELSLARFAAGAPRGLRAGRRDRDPDRREQQCRGGTRLQRLRRKRRRHLHSRQRRTRGHHPQDRDRAVGRARHPHRSMPRPGRLAQACRRSLPLQHRGRDHPGNHGGWRGRRRRGAGTRDPALARRVLEVARRPALLASRFLTAACNGNEPVCKLSAFSYSILADGSLVKTHNSTRAVDGDPLACLDAFRGVGYADYRRYAVFAGHDGAVGHGSSHLHDEAARREEEGGPTGVRRWRNQDLTRLQMCAAGVQDHARLSGYHPTRGRRAAQNIARPGLTVLICSRFGAVGEEEARHVLAYQLLLIDRATFANDNTEILAGQGRPRLGYADEEDIPGFLQAPGLRQLFADGPQQVPDPRQEQDDRELGRLPQSGKLPGPSQQEPDERPAQTALPTRAAAQLLDHLFGLARRPSELYVGGRLWILQAQVIRQTTLQLRGK